MRTHLEPESARPFPWRARRLALEVEAEVSDGVRRRCPVGAEEEGEGGDRGGYVVHFFGLENGGVAGENGEGKVYTMREATAEAGGRSIYGVKSS